MKKIIAWLMVFALMLTAGCGSSSEEESSKKSSIANPLSGDAADCANVVKILLDQQLHYNNDAAENLMHKALLAVHGTPFPLNETDENFGRYSKAALRETLRWYFMHCSRFDDRRLSYTTADEISAAFSDLIKMTKYDVTPSGKTVELDGEYQELDVHIEYPDIAQINQRALEKLNTALKSKYGVGSSDPDKIVAETDRYGFEKLDRLLEYGYAFANHWSPSQTPAQHAEFDEIVRDAYLSVLSDKNNLPHKTYDGTIHIAKRNSKGIVGYVFWDKDESFLPLHIDIWEPLFPANTHAVLDSGLKDALKIAVRDTRLDGSNQTMDVSLFVNNKTDKDIVLQYDVCDAYDKSLGWQWLSPNNEYIPLENQEFVLANGASKNVDWKLRAGSVSSEPFMFRVRVDFKDYIYVPFASAPAVRPSEPQQPSKPAVIDPSLDDDNTSTGEIAPGRSLGADDLRFQSDDEQLG